MSSVRQASGSSGDAQHRARKPAKEGAATNMNLVTASAPSLVSAHREGRHGTPDLKVS